MNKEKFMNKLVMFRKERGVSQQEIARRIGTHQSNVSRIEAGHVDPSLSFIVAYVEALGGRLEICDE